MDTKSRGIESFERKKLSSSIQSFRRYSLCIYYYHRRIRGTIPPPPRLKELYEGWKLGGRTRVLRYPLELPVDTKDVGERSKILSFLARRVLFRRFDFLLGWRSRSTRKSSEEWLMHNRDATLQPVERFPRIPSYLQKPGRCLRSRNLRNFQPLYIWYTRYTLWQFNSLIIAPTHSFIQDAKINRRMKLCSWTLII